MVKYARRAYLNNLALGATELDGETSRYLTAVLRLRDGDQIEFFDGRGQSASAVIQEACKRKTKVELLSLTSTKPPSPEVHIACAIPKGERSDWLVEKCSELGANSITWVIYERSQDHRKDHRKRFARWSKIAQEAVRQSHNTWMPEFHGPLSFEEMLQKYPVESKIVRLVLDTTVDTAPLSSLQFTPSQSIVLCVGTEGGFTALERQQFRSSGWQAMTLGPAVLRVETAAVVGLGSLQTLSSVSEAEGQ